MIFQVFEKRKSSIFIIKGDEKYASSVRLGNKGIIFEENSGKKDKKGKQLCKSRLYSI